MENEIRIPEKLPRVVLEQLDYWRRCIEIYLALRAEGLTYAQAAVRFKRSEVTIRKAEKRVLEVLAEEDAMAALEGKDPERIESVSTDDNRFKEWGEEGQE